MKRLLILIVILSGALWAYYAFFKKKDQKQSVPKDQPMVVKIHSDAFNNSVDKVIANYLGMKDAFVNGDSATAKAKDQAFINSLDSIPLEELDKDKVAVAATAKASIADIKANASSLLMQKSITEMRRDFSMITEMMYPSFFQSINYEGKKLYFDHCPMAFDDAGANWLSDNAKIVNPYLGNNHPKFHATMLECGEVKDSVSIAN